MGQSMAFWKAAVPNWSKPNASVTKQRRMEP
jgi:hypothetical protein